MACLINYPSKIAKYYHIVCSKWGADVNKFIIIFAGNCMNMRHKLSFLLPFLATVLVLTLCNENSSAQIRKNGGGKKRSWYFSGGMNAAFFNKPTIHVEQPNIGNSYDLLNVTADNKNGSSTISPWLLNYRVGWYFNYFQTCGLELNFDPVVFHIKDNQTVQASGTMNDIHINTNINFPAKGGYYYALNGTNLVLLNFVRRFTVYRPVKNKIALDALAKVGFGPVLPRVSTNLGGTVVSEPTLQYGGLNAGLEGAFRSTFFRYVYLEFAAKYDYAMLNNLKVYEGTASHNISTMEFIASIGFTFPTHRFNPLFYKPKDIVTIMPLFTIRSTKDRAKGWKKGKIDYSESKKEQKKAKGDKNKSDQEMVDIPEFSEITDKIERKRLQDSAMAQAKEDSIFKAEHPEMKDTTQVAPDSSQVKDGKDKSEGKKAKKKKKNKKGEAEAVTAPAVDSSAAPAAGVDATVPPAPEKAEAKPEEKPKDEKPKEEKAAEEKKDAPEPPKAEEEPKMSKKELKKLEKQKKKDEEKKAKEDKKLAEQKAKEEQDKLEQEKKDKEEQEKKDKEAQDKKEEGK